MTEPQRLPDRRIAALGGVAGGVLMALGTLLPWEVAADGNLDGIAYFTGRMMLFLGIAVAIVGGAALAVSGSRVWLLLALLSSIGLLIAVYQFARGHVTISTVGIGFLVTSLGVGLGLLSAVRGMALRR